MSENSSHGQSGAIMVVEWVGMGIMAAVYLMGVIVSSYHQTLTFRRSSRSLPSLKQFIVKINWKKENPRAGPSDRTIVVDTSDGEPEYSN